MNPHFIFNSVQNIRSLINNKQDKAAVDYLDKFSKLTRQVLENSEENYISMEEEVEMIENYLSIQQLIVGKPNTNQASIDMSGFKSGAYFVKIEAGNKLKTVKIIKE